MITAMVKSGEYLEVNKCVSDFDSKCASISVTGNG